MIRCRKHCSHRALIVAEPSTNGTSCSCTFLCEDGTVVWPHTLHAFVILPFLQIRNPSQAQSQFSFFNQHEQVDMLKYYMIIRRCMSHISPCRCHVHRTKIMDCLGLGGTHFQGPALLGNLDSVDITRRIGSLICSSLTLNVIYTGQLVV